MESCSGVHQLLKQNPFYSGHLCFTPAVCQALYLIIQELNFSPEFYWGTRKYWLVLLAKCHSSVSSVIHSLILFISRQVSCFLILNQIPSGWVESIIVACVISHMDNSIYIVGRKAETCFCTLLINLVKADWQVAISPKLPTFPPLSSPNATLELAHWSKANHLP